MRKFHEFHFYSIAIIIFFPKKYFHVNLRYIFNISTYFKLNRILYCLIFFLKKKNQKSVSNRATKISLTIFAEENFKLINISTCKVHTTLK